MGYTEDIMQLFLISIIGLLPCLTIVILNIALVILAVKKSNSEINIMKLLTVLLVTVGFLTSYIPYILFAARQINTTMDYDQIAWAISFLSSMINPFIYWATNPTFKEFTKRKLLCRDNVVNQSNRS